MKIGELFVQLGVKADTFTVKEFARAVADIPLAAIGAIASLGGLSFGIMELTKNTLNLSNNLGTFRDETGLSMVELQRWTGVAKQVGLSGDVVQSSIMGITNAMAQLRLGNGAALLPLGRLGVDVRGKNPFQILQEIGKNSQRMDPNVARQLMGQLGIAPEMMRIFALGPGQFNRMASRGVVMTSGEQKSMQDFQAALARFELTLEKDFIPILEKSLPIIEGLTEILGKFITLVGPVAVKWIGGAVNEANSLTTKKGQLELANFLLSASSPQLALLKAVAKMNYPEMYVTQHIQSTANAEEVARIAHEHMKHEHAKASKQFNNGGY